MRSYCFLEILDFVKINVHSVFKNNILYFRVFIISSWEPLNELVGKDLRESKEQHIKMKPLKTLCVDSCQHGRHPKCKQNRRGENR